MKKIRKKKKKLTFIIISIFLILIAFAIGTIIFIKIYKEKNTLQITLISNLNVEINSKVNLLSFVKDIKNGQIITQDTEIDTSKLGNQNLELLTQNSFNEEEKINFKIKIVDTTKPSIKAKEEITIYKGKEINLLEHVSATDNSKEEISIEIEGNYDINTIGEYPLSFIASDSSKNQSKADFVLKVIEDPNNYSFKTEKGYTANVINGVTYIDGILIANKSYKLPNNYGNGLTKETTKAFNQMDADATSLGLNLYISSGYRSYYDQKYIYNNYVKRDGQAKADTYSARAGHSEHQTGLAFDLNSINDSFTNTPEGVWVKDNCYKYGLILRYPKGKEDITGYMHESWHLRYVGVELATKLYNNGNWITIEEYFGIDSKYT